MGNGEGETWRGISGTIIGRIFFRENQLMKFYEAQLENEPCSLAFIHLLYNKFRFQSSSFIIFFIIKK